MINDNKSRYLVNNLIKSFNHLNAWNLLPNGRFYSQNKI